MVAGTAGDGWEWDLLLLTVLDGEVGIVETIRAAGDGWPRWVFTGPPGVYTARLIARQPGRRVESVHRVTIGDAPRPGPQPQPPGPQPEPEPEPTPAGWSAWIEANRPKNRPEWATEAKAAAGAFRAAADAGTWSTGRELAEQTAAQLATALGPAAFLAWAGFRRALSGRLAGLELTTAEQHRAAWQEIAAALERGA